MRVRHGLQVRSGLLTAIRRLQLHMEWVVGANARAHDCGANPDTNIWTNDDTKPRSNPRSEHEPVVDAVACPVLVTKHGPFVLPVLDSDHEPSDWIPKHGPKQVANRETDNSGSIAESFARADITHGGAVPFPH